MATPGTGSVYARYKVSNGKRVRRPCWYFYVIDHNGNRIDRKGFPDKAATEEKLRQEKKRIARLVVGLEVPNADALQTPLAEHLESFLIAKQADSVSAKQVKLLRSRVTGAFNKMGARIFTDLTEQRVKELLVLETQSRDLSKKTKNEIISALKGFSKWLAVTNRWPDPLAALKLIRGEDDVRLHRFSLTEEQLEKLFAAARQRGVAEYLKGHPNASTGAIEQIARLGQEREMVYRIGALLGLRRNEIATLAWGDLQLTTEIPSCTIKASNAKSKRTDTVPVNSALAESLREWKKTCAKALGREPRDNELVVRVPRHINEQLKKDCMFAGIAMSNEKGEQLDFYAATRHTFCTLLGRAKLSPHVQRELMRHTDLKMTLKYTHMNLLDLQKGAEALPAMPTAAAGSAALSQELAAPMPTATASSAAPSQGLGAAGISLAKRAKLMPKESRASALTGSTQCNERESKSESDDSGKSECEQDLSSPDNAEQEFARIVSIFEEWWRRRESKPSPPPRQMLTTEITPGYKIFFRRKSPSVTRFVTDLTSNFWTRHQSPPPEKYLLRLLRIGFLFCKLSISLGICICSNSLYPAQVLDQKAFCGFSPS